jgi:DNA-binding winged helix-turn-helix (wHTH) protein
MTSADSPRFAFDKFVLDCGAGELRRHGVVVDLRPKVYDLLRYLLEHAGRLVPKEELLDAIWGDVHVSDGSLNRTMAELRDILADDAREPRLIETAARRGYRFIASVRDVRDGVDSSFVLVFADRVVPLRAGETIIGRIPECDVQVIGPSVSRRHARIVAGPDGVSIEDLGSTNGTFVSGQRVTAPTPVTDGTEIKVGKEGFRLVSDRAIRARTEPAI